MGRQGRGRGNRRAVVGRLMGSRWLDQSAQFTSLLQSDMVIRLLRTSASSHTASVNLAQRLSHGHPGPSHVVENWPTSGAG